MKAIFGFLIISVLLLASCSTAQYSTATYDDEIYGSSSSPAMNIKVTEDNSNYQTPKYAENRNTYSNEYRNIYTDTEDNGARENESSRIAAQEYYKRDTVYYEGDSIIYVEEAVEEEPYYGDEYDFDYATRIKTFHRPNWRYNYYGYYDPFYYSFYSGYPNYYDSYWDFGWSFNSGLYLSWAWPFNYYHNPYYNNYWGYYPYYGYGNFAINHYYSNNNSYYYGPRTNRGRNSGSYNQVPRTSNSLNRSSIKSSSTLNAPAGNTKRQNRTVVNTVDRNKNLNIQSQKNIERNVYTTQRGNLDRKQVYTKQGATNAASQNKAIVRYRKPKTYTSPSTRSTGTSREYQLSRGTQDRTQTTTRTVKRVVANPDRTKNYSTPTKSRNLQYKTSTRSSGSNTYSTPSRSIRSSSSSSISTPSRSSSSGSRSGSSSGGSSGRRR